MEEKVARPRRPYRDDKTKKILVPFESRLIPSLRDPTRPRVPSYSSLPVLSLSLSYPGKYSMLKINLARGDR